MYPKEGGISALLFPENELPVSKLRSDSKMKVVAIKICSPNNWFMRISILSYRKITFLVIFLPNNREDHGYRQARGNVREEL